MVGLASMMVLMTSSHCTVYRLLSVASGAFVFAIFAHFVIGFLSNFVAILVGDFQYTASRRKKSSQNAFFYVLRVVIPVDGHQVIHTMIEVLTFFNSVSSNKWVQALWSRLKQIREEREKELDQINTIIFGDPVELAKYYVEPDCQEMNPADRRVDDEMVSKQSIMVKINQFFRQQSFHHGSNQLFILSDAGMGKSALLAMLKLMYLTKFWPGDRSCVLKKLGRSSLDEIKAIANKRRTILLLDSLDEDPMAYGRVRERLMDVLEASQHFSKVIITCRTQFFPETDKHQLEQPGQVSVGGYRCYSKYLSFFNNQKVHQYLLKRFPKKVFKLGSEQKKIDEAKNIIGKTDISALDLTLIRQVEPLHPKGKNYRPVVNVSWDDVQEFILKINQVEKQARFTLPSEAQWEYACRAGTRTRFYSGGNDQDLDRVGWYSENSGEEIHSVRQKKPNAFGLFDMHGNVWEWVEDDYHKDYNGAPNIGNAWIDKPRGPDRVVRGGAWNYPASHCRSAHRLYFGPGIRNSVLGFRLILLAGQPG